MMGVPDRTVDPNGNDQMDVYQAIEAERNRQKAWGSDEFDKGNTRNDWIAYIVSYAGDAAKVKKKEKSGTEEDMRFVRNLVKVAALAIAAIEAHEKGYC